MAKLHVKDWRTTLLVGVSIGTFAAAPLSVHALTSQDDTDTTQTQASDTTAPASETTDDSTQAADTPADTTTTDPATTDTTGTDTPVTQTPDPSPDPEQPGETDTTTSPTVADLQTAITIAAAEHPNVQAVSAKLKNLNGNDVYKVVFADGWVAYVSASNGSVLLLENKDGDKQTCHNNARSSWLKNHKNWQPFAAEFSAYSHSWLAKKNWANAKHNWQPQQTTQTAPTDQSDSSTSSTTATSTTQAKTTTNTNTQNHDNHTRTNSRRH